MNEEIDKLYLASLTDHISYTDFSDVTKKTRLFNKYRGELEKQKRILCTDINNSTPLDKILSFFIQLTTMSITIIHTLYDSSLIGPYKKKRTIGDIFNDGSISDTSTTELTVFVEALKLLECIQNMNKEYLNEGDFIKIFTAYIWIHLKWFAAHTLNINSFTDNIVTFINSVTRPNYVIKKCRNDINVNTNPSNYTCGRALLVNTYCPELETKILLFNTVSADNDNMDTDMLNELCGKKTSGGGTKIIKTKSNRKVNKKKKTKTKSKTKSKSNRKVNKN
jgi:hypothetical protein